MKRKMSVLVLFVLIFALAAAILPTSATSADGTTEKGLVYEVRIGGPNGPR